MRRTAIMPVEPDLLPDEPSRATAARSLLVLKVKSKPSLSAVGGSGSTKSTGFYLSSRSFENDLPIRAYSE